jgi:DNA-binding beta-propeller fold protein YncE
MRLIVVAVSCIFAGAAFAADKPVMAPIFEVDPFWPKPLPNHWVTGSTIGLSIDTQDNVWTLHRRESVPDDLRAADLTVAQAVDDEALPGAKGPVNGNDPIGVCCKVAPEVLVYDQSGALIKSWGGKGAGYEWPERNHGLTVDHKGNIWIGGNGETDTHVLKFAADGKFLLQVGKQGVHNGSNDLANFWKPSKIYPDPAANEVYVSDGYGNRRIVVLDADTGKYKRHWGAYGAKPDDAAMPPYNPASPPSKQFSTVHCVVVSNDGLVYVCDRVNDRIQVFTKAGKFVKEARIDPKTYRSGSVWDIAFSRDPQQAYLYVANGVDEKINVVSRETLEVLTSFGDGGRQPGQFFGVHNLATDSKGNLYATETYTGARIQRFLFKGVGPVTKRDQGVVWPQGK